MVGKLWNHENTMWWRPLTHFTWKIRVSSEHASGFMMSQFPYHELSSWRWGRWKQRKYSFDLIGVCRARHQLPAMLTEPVYSRSILTSTIWIAWPPAWFNKPGIRRVVSQLSLFHIRLSYCPFGFRGTHLHLLFGLVLVFLIR